MRKYDRKILWRGIVHAAILLALLIYERVSIDSTDSLLPYRFILRGYIAISYAVYHFRWLFMYDAFKPSAKIFDFSFRKERVLPHFIEGEPKMNSVMVISHIWFVLLLIGFITYV